MFHKCRLSPHSVAAIVLAATLWLMPTQITAEQQTPSNLFGSALLDQPPALAQDREMIHATALVGDTLYIRTSNHLYTYAPGDRAATRRAPLPYYHDASASLAGAYGEGAPFVTPIFSDGSGLYGLDVAAQTMYALRLDAGSVCYDKPLALDLSDLLRGEAPDSYVSQPLWLLVADGRLYMQGEDEAHQPGKLISFDMFSGKKQAHGAEGLVSAAAYQAGKLIALRRDRASAAPGLTIVSYDPARDSLEKLGIFTEYTGHGEPPMSICYAADEDSLYLYTDAAVYRYAPHAHGLKSQLVARLPMLGISSPRVQGGITHLPGGQLALAFPQNIFLRAADGSGLNHQLSLMIGQGLPQDEPEQLMRILMRMDNVFLQVHTASAQMDEATFAAHLLTGLVDADLMPLKLKRFDLGKLIDKGYLLALPKNQGIGDAMAGLADNLAAALMREGRIYALPIALTLRPVTANPLGFEAAGIPVPASFTELLDLADSWRAGLWEQHPGYRLFSDQGSDKALLRQLLIDSYIHSRFAKGLDLSFDSPVFRAYMRRIEGMAAAEYEADAPMASLQAAAMQAAEDRPWLISVSESFAPRDRTGVNNQDEGRRVYLNLPLTEGEAAYQEAELTVLAALSTTKHPEAATRFIQLYAATMNPIDYAAMRPGQARDIPNPDYDMAMRNHEKVLADIQGWYDQAEGAQQRAMAESLAWARRKVEEGRQGLKYLATKEDFEQLAAIVGRLYLPSGLQQAQRKAFAAHHHVLKQYFDGAISLEQFIETMDAKLRLVRLEYR